MALKVIFHLDEMPKWNLLLKNVRNLLDAAPGSDSMQIEVLANAEAVRFYVRAESSEDAVKMRALSGAGVRFVACNNALNGLGISENELVPFVEIVPAGVLELIRRQSDGFAYIKP